MARPSNNVRGSGFGVRGQKLCRLPTADRLLSLQGQSILEYLILIMALALVILALRGRLNGAVDNLYNAAADKVDQAAANLRGM